MSKRKNFLQPDWPIEIIAVDNVDERKVERDPTFRGSVFVRWKVANRIRLISDEIQQQSSTENKMAKF